MEITESYIHERIKDRKAELEHHRINNSWGDCMYLSGQITELQSLALEVASQPGVEADALKCRICGTEIRMDCPNCNRAFGG